ncbi:MAG: malonyl-ACP O-methyltransferase BioC [Steroidobacteraceae bacterium]|nr:malonyl-ACP O-methyltransferase BioC [Steroidobacteraceae bacterium]
MPLSRETAAYSCERMALRRAFDLAAPSYDGAAILQAEVREELLRRLDVVTLSPRLVVDAGAGTGHASRALRRRYPRARVLAVDIALGMLRASRRQQSWWRRFDRVCGDLARLPFADASVDLLYSNLALPWCEPDAALAEARRVLAPGGLFSFTSFGPDTLHELRAAWSSADAQVHVMQFFDMHDLGDALVRAGFAQPVLDVERYTVSYADVGGLMGDLQACGASNVLAGRTRSLTGKGRLRAMRSAYEKFRRDERLPATCEVVFGHAWGVAPASNATTPPRNADTSIAIDEFRRQLRARR